MTALTPAPDPVAVLLHHLARHGVELQAVAGRLRFRPVDAVGPELRARLAEHKPAILARLAAGDSRRRLADALGAAPDLSDFNDWAAANFRELNPRDPADRAVLAWIASGRREATNAEALARAGCDARGFRLPARDANGETSIQRASRWRREAAAQRGTAK